MHYVQSLLPYSSALARLSDVLCGCSKCSYCLNFIISVYLFPCQVCSQARGCRHFWLASLSECGRWDCFTIQSWVDRLSHVPAFNLEGDSLYVHLSYGTFKEFVFGASHKCHWNHSFAIQSLPCIPWCMCICSTLQMLPLIAVIWFVWFKSMWL